MQESSLAIYGSSFQMKSISALISDPEYIAQVFDIIKADYYDSKSLQWILNKTINHYEQYKKPPTLEVFKVHLDRVDNDVLTSEIKKDLRSIVQFTESHDLPFIKETTLTFCKNQEIKLAIIESANYLEAGNYDKIREVINRAMNVGVGQDLGINYIDNITSRYEEQARQPISTGWNELDILMKGGLSYGELGLVIAPSGAGKSWMLAKMGAAAVELGKKVLHITLELHEGYTAQRYDTIFTHTPAVILKENLNSLQAKIEKLPGELRIKWFPMKSLTTAGLESFINKLKLTGFDPDLVIIDYADIMRLPAKKDRTEALGEMYEELRGLAGVFKIPIWTASQTRREGMNNDYIEGDNIAGAYAKIFTCDFVFSISRKASDKVSNTARTHIIKNRFGADGMTLPMKFEAERAVIEIYAEMTSEGITQRTKMVDDTKYERGILKNKYLSLMTKSADF